jgi:negative regulator of flagellin synthesis FlgM
MSNPIEGYSTVRPAVPTSGPEQVRKANGSANSKAAETNTSADVVNLTSTAETLKGLEQSLANAPVVNREKVETIIGALASGQYTINSERVAKKFMEIEMTLGKL